MENDLISRSALLPELQSYKEGLSFVFESLEQGVEKRICGAEICGVLEAIIQVKNAPAVDAETLRPKGQWVNEQILVGGLAEKWGYDCSVCGKTVENHKYNYCPNCGADMREG